MEQEESSNTEFQPNSNNEKNTSYIQRASVTLKYEYNTVFVAVFVCIIISI